MNIVTVQASKSYDIQIGSGLLSVLGQALSQLGKVQKVCIVSDSNVFPLYGSAVIQETERAGFQVCSYVFPAGEASKNGQTYLELLNHLAQNRLTRTDAIVALGGGVVGDLAGFAAATYLRGIRFVQIPTTLLAAVDSSVGGKTAIDLPAGKNLTGAFYQPSLVLCDTDALQTLPRETFLDGCAEVIKYGVLYDPQLFSLLEAQGPAFDREDVITRCIQWKRDVVAEDEFDTGARMRLNLGHTIGHGIEAASDFAVSHGKAVAAGMAIISRSASQKGLLDPVDCGRIEDVLRRFGLPTDTCYPAQKLCSSALSDKKRTGSLIRLIVPRKIGYCDIVNVPVEETESWIQLGM